MSLETRKEYSGDHKYLFGRQCSKKMSLMRVGFGACMYLLQTETLSYKTIVVGCVGGGVFYNINIINIILVRNAIFKVNVPLSM